MTIGILDYGAGNLFSIQCGIRRVGLQPQVLSNPREIRDVDALVIPGVGNFSQAVKSLVEYKTPLRQFVDQGGILLGICLGMQILLEKSEEGLGDGLALIPGAVRSLPSLEKVPHMGWNTVTSENDCPLLADIEDNSYFYFVHSYFAEPEDARNIIATTEYGIPFPSVIANDSVYGLQFHPEKSGKTGTKILSNFRTVVRR